MQQHEGPLKQPSGRFQLGEWLVDPDANLLSRAGEQRSLRAKAMELLLLLLQRPNETISRDEIVASVWNGNEAVAAQGINNAVWSIRQVLDDDADTPRYLQTIPKKGYRLIASVQRLAAPASDIEPSESAADPTTIVESIDATQSRMRYGWLVLASLVAVLLLVVVWPHQQNEQQRHLQQQQQSTQSVHSDIRALTSYSGMEYLGQLSPDGQLLAFAWWQSTGKGLLYLRRLQDEAAAPIRLSDIDHDITSISWSADGKRLAFTELTSAEECRVAIYSLQSNRIERIASCSPLWTPTLAWSPVADQLIYTGQLANQAPGLVLHDLASGQLQQLTSSTGLLADHQPAWSPDGQRVAFVRSDGGSGSRDIHVADMLGSIVRLSDSRFHDLHGLTWQQDGDALIYSTTQQGSRMLWQLDLQSHQARPLGLEGSAPQSHAKGLLYSLFKKHQRLGQLTLEPAAARLQPLAGGVTSEQSPDYSRHQQALVFVSARSGFRELWRSGPDGQHAQQLTHLQSIVQRPRWSPDGQAIAFIGGCTADRYGLCLLDVASGKVLTLNTDSSNYGSPVWRDDGRALYVLAAEAGRNQLWQIDRDSGVRHQLLTAHEPLLLQKRPDQAELFYLTRAGSQFQQINPVTGAELTLQLGTGWPANVVAWLLLPDGVLVLQREQSERWQRYQSEQVGWQPLAEFPLGTFAEFPDLSLGAERNQLYLELADTAYADLMLAR